MQKIYYFCGTTKENARLKPDTFRCVFNRKVAFYYFLLASMTRSIPKLDRLIETTTPKAKIAIGTRSSIGIAYSSVLFRDS